ncbi:hypothetical protein FQN57_001475 [Myotisia sp. PD_48]|nr:hypothetical protein FQN57_001475 [Myotisia sp. PD_48]
MSRNMGTEETMHTVKIESPKEFKCILSFVPPIFLQRPMRKFNSPFLNKTDEEIRTWVYKILYKSTQDPDQTFASSTFTILNDTNKYKTCRMGYIDDIDPDYRMLRTDFYVNLYLRVPIEIATTEWDFGQLDTGELVTKDSLGSIESRGNVDVEPPAIFGKKEHLTVVVPRRESSAQGAGLSGTFAKAKAAGPESIVRQNVLEGDPKDRKLGSPAAAAHYRQAKKKAEEWRQKGVGSHQTNQLYPISNCNMLHCYSFV